MKFWVLAFLLVLVGCSSGTPQDLRKPVPRPSPTVTVASSGIVVAQGHGWAAGGLFGPKFYADSCKYRNNSGGILPDPTCTPGSTDSAVTQSDISSTICRSGYTSTVRPPSSLTSSAKRESAREYGTTTAAGEYDHLISLELGGSSDTRNLWVEADGKIPNAKDSVENNLKALVCASGKHLDLAVAQYLIATDWTTALAKARTQLH